MTAVVAKGVDFKTCYVTLRNLIAFHSERKCSDQRDKVYALLSLAKDGEELGLVPDYGIAIGDLFFDMLLCYPGDWNFWHTLQRSLGVTLGELQKCSILRGYHDVS